MDCLFSRNWHTSVRRAQGEILAAETGYVDTNREAVARLLVGVPDFIIRGAEWEEQRPVSPDGRKLQPVPALQGKDSYFNSGPVLRKLASVTDDPLLVPLFAETVKGVIQAETFLWEERGYPSAAAYERNWEENYKGACRYYSNPDRVSRGWFQHVGETRREGNLFVRFKTQSLYALGSGNFLLSGDLSDSFHQVSVTFTLDRDKVVERAEGRLLRAPDPVCREAAVFLDALVGIRLKGISKKEMANRLGKGQGCVHLIDLAYDVAQVLAHMP